MTSSERAEGEGRAYIAMLFAGTVELIVFGAIYLAYSWFAS
jgi:hypothetical protein